MSFFARILILLLALQIAGTPVWAAVNADVNLAHDNIIFDQQGSDTHAQTCCQINTEAQCNDGCAQACMTGCMAITMLKSEANASQQNLAEHHTPFSHILYTSYSLPPDTPPPSA